MATVSMEAGLIVASVLFALGLWGLLMRRNVIFVLMSLEIMMNSAGLAFISAGARWMQPDGQIMYILILALAASEVAVGLALVLQVYRRFVSLDTDALSTMKG
jgi:NADH-quinone oxidoreductase subunit K